MKKNIVLLCLLVVNKLIIAQSYSGPESVEYDYTRNCYYISNTQSHQILKREANGTLSVFASGITSGPHGLEIIDDTLYACSGGALRAYNLINGNPLYTVNVGATFLNGITHKGNILYITDFTAKKVYRFNAVSKQYNEFTGTLNKTPNGIIYDDINDRLVMVSWGANAPVYEINLNDSSVALLTTTSLGNCDGIAMNCNGQFFISSWSPNRISRFENDFIAPPVNMNATGLSSPADIFFNKNADTLAVPNSGNNTVTFYHYPSCLNLSVPNHDLNYNIKNLPDSWQITINNGSISEAELFDLAGKKTGILAVSGKQISITKPTTPGIYILKIKTENQLSVLKLCNVQ
jgi:glutamine cyclotransferase